MCVRERERERERESMCLSAFSVFAHAVVITGVSVVSVSVLQGRSISEQEVRDLCYIVLRGKFYRLVLAFVLAKETNHI